MIDARHIEKRFGHVRAVRGVSFEARPGEVLGLLGPNGAGKTTTIRMLTGYLPPDGGRVAVDGLDTLDDSLEARARIGYLPESTPLYPEMTVDSLLRHRASLLRVPRRERRSAVDRAIERCWLGEMRTRRVGALSKGYRQRVGLAAAILHDPPNLILDEPTSGLDPAQIAEMRNLIHELGRDRTLILSSHILSEVERTCDRVIVIARGRVYADGPVPELAGGRAGESRYIVEIKPPAGTPNGAWLDVFRGAEGVERVDDSPIDGDWRKLTILPATGAADLRETLAQAASDASLQIRELHRQQPTLESVFLDLITRAEREDAG